MRKSVRVGAFSFFPPHLQTTLVPCSTLLMHLLALGIHNPDWSKHPFIFSCFAKIQSPRALIKSPKRDGWWIRRRNTEGNGTYDFNFFCVVLALGAGCLQVIFQLCLQKRDVFL